MEAAVLDGHGVVFLKQVLNSSSFYAKTIAKLKLNASRSKSELTKPATAAYIAEAGAVLDATLPAPVAAEAGAAISAALPSPAEAGAAVDAALPAVLTTAPAPEAGAIVVSDAAAPPAVEAGLAEAGAVVSAAPPAMLTTAAEAGAVVVSDAVAAPATVAAVEALCGRVEAIVARSLEDHRTTVAQSFEHRPAVQTSAEILFELTPILTLRVSPSSSSR